MIISRNTKRAVAVTAVLVLSACGSSSDDDDPLVQGDSTTNTPVVAEAPVVTDSPDNDDTGGTVTNPDLSAGDVPIDSALADVAGSDFFTGSDI